MDNYRWVLKRTGLVLIVVGLLDIAYMVYCITHGVGYSSSFNICAVVAGLFLLKGHLGAVQLITRFAAFMLSASLGMVLVLFPLLMPPGLWRARWHLDPLGTLGGVVFMVAAVALVFWIYRQLRVPSVVQARIAAGQSASPPRLALLVGALLVVGLAVVLHFTLRGETAARAIQLAQAKKGLAYEYCVTSMNWGGDHGRATVAAYNDREIKSVDVAW
ncbi:MAG: hypothetical protein ABI227_02185 [Rhodanobacter sp.]